MINIKPDFYPDFSCIADKCADSCCIGWEIDIDDNTFEKYKIIDSTFGEKIRNNISVEETLHFKLCENDRCSLLNDDGLCEIIINCGEDYLCDICREHPRFYEWYGNYRDCGIGLCCEEACRLLFSSDKALSFTEENDEISDDNEINIETAQRIFYIRKNLIEMLSQRSKSKLADRIRLCAEYISEYQNNFEDNISLKVAETAGELFEIMKEAEAFDEKWTEFTDNFSFDKLKINASFSAEDYERLFAYLIFRHFIKAVYDGDLITHFKICLFYFTAVLLYSESNFQLNKIEAVKYISKQFEYSDENTSLIELECADNPKLSFENLVNCIEYLL